MDPLTVLTTRVAILQFRVSLSPAVAQADPGAILLRHRGVILGAAWI